MCARKKKAATDKEIIVDTKSGSLSYNRLDMQVTQTLHMAIELFPTLDYLFVLDYYDDIALFDSENSPASVSYYQLKTNEESISISTAISEDWIAKLYKHLEKPEWIVQELGLITNCPLKVSVTTKDDKGKSHQHTTLYTSEKTSFSTFNPQTIESIRQDISEKFHIDINDVDLTKFVHMRTTLSIPKHREIVEQEMHDFLYKQHPRITIDVAKTIFGAMMDLLTRRQAYELLDKNAVFEVAREKKGVSKNDFKRIIDDALIVAIPPFPDIQDAMNYSGDDVYRASFEYTKILTDHQSKSESFVAQFKKLRILILENPQGNDELMQDYAQRIFELLPTKSPIYSQTYIHVLVACIRINEWRRTL